MARLTPGTTHEQVALDRHVDRHRVARGDWIRCHRTVTRRNDQRRLAGGRRRSAPTWWRIGSTPASSPTGCSASTTAVPHRPSGSTTAATSCPRTSGSLFGHHFAAIAGAGPLVGPTLAAQFGYLPGTLWIIVGVVLGGAVQDCRDPVRVDPPRRQVARPDGAARRSDPVAGFAALVAVFAIMIILLAVLALVVVNALSDSPWGLFTDRLHHARSRLFMGSVCAVHPARPGAGGHGDRRRPAAGARSSAAVGARQHPTLAPMFTCRGTQLALGRHRLRLRRPPRCRSGCCSRRATTCARS